MTAPNAPMSADALALSILDTVIFQRMRKLTLMTCEAQTKAHEATIALGTAKAEIARLELVQVPALVKDVEALRADAERLDWFDKNGFTAYRQIDPIDGLSSHCVVVHETQKPRRGNVADGIRAAIDAARAEARDGK